MPKIPILGPTQQGVDETVPQQGGSVVIDGFFDEGGALNKRPGLFSLFNCGTGKPVNGVYWWREKKTLLVCSGRHIFAITTLGQPSKIITPSSESLRLADYEPVSFASTEQWVYMTNGGKVIAWNGDTAQFAQDASAPMSACSHLAYLDGYILGNEVGSQTFYYTDLLTETSTTPATWNAVGINAEGAPDPLLALKVGWREIVLVGERSTEIWYNSGADVPFARLEGSFIEQGISAKHSIVSADNTWIWLNHERQVIRLEGRTPKVLSAPVENYLRWFTKVEDAIGTIVEHFYVLSFPWADYTLVFDLKNGGWYIWSKWEPEKSWYNRFLGQLSVFVPEWNTWLMAGRRNGQLYVFDKSLMTDAGELIRTCYRSAHFDHGTLRRKRSKRLYLRLKRGS